MSETINPSRIPTHTGDTGRAPIPASPAEPSPRSDPRDNSKTIPKKKKERGEAILFFLGSIFLGIGEYNRYRWTLIEHDIMRKVAVLSENAISADVKDGSVIQAHGKLSSSAPPPVDRFFDVPIAAPKNAFVLLRKVERYQKHCSGKTCSMRWSSDQTQHSDVTWPTFGPMPATSCSKDAKIANFGLDCEVLSRASWAQRQTLPAALREKTVKKSDGNLNQWTCDQTTCYSGDPTKHTRGDYRVWYEFAGTVPHAAALGKYSAEDKKLHPIATVFGKEQISSLIEGNEIHPLNSVKACTNHTSVDDNSHRLLGIGLISLAASELALRPLQKTAIGASLAASIVSLPRLYFLLRFGRVIVPFGGSIAIFSRDDEQKKKEDAF